MTGSLRFEPFPGGDSYSPVDVSSQIDAFQEKEYSEVQDYPFPYPVAMRLLSLQPASGHCQRYSSNIRSSKQYADG
jgi:hypothetical protein